MKSSASRRPAINRLPTEQRNASSLDLDIRSPLQIAQIINSEDAKVATAVRRALPQIARGIEMIADSLRQGGRLIYVGAGTSGRIAALDAAECPPTFGVSPTTVQFVIAGGTRALSSAVEANEDSRQLGQSEIARRKPGKADVVVGIAASGRTPFTIAAVEYARRRGAKTIAVTCNQESELARVAYLAIVAEVGPEVISGSSRMKAGTAQKMVLNMLSTGALARLGYVYDNLMVNVQTTNQKLVARGISILERAANVTPDAARRALKASGNNVAVALVMLKASVTRKQAQSALRAAHGNVRQAVVSAGGSRSV